MAVDNNPNDENLEGVHGRPATPEEVAQRDGYVRGRNDENYVQRNLRDQDRVIAQARSDDSAASGMVFGLVIALLAAGVGAAFFFLSGDRTEPAPVAAPQIQKERVVEKETTIIEKQAPAPAVSIPDVQIDVPEIKAPDVNITNEAPEPAPAAEAPPAAGTETPSEPEPAEPQ